MYIYIINLPSFSLSTILDVNEVETVSAVPWKKSINGTVSNNFNINDHYKVKCLVTCIMVDFVKFTYV